MPSGSTRRGLLAIAWVVCALVASSGPAAGECTSPDLSKGKAQQCASKRSAALRRCLARKIPIAACDVSASAAACGALSTTCTPAHDVDLAAQIVYGGAEANDACHKQLFLQATHLLSRELALARSNHPDRLALETSRCITRAAKRCATTPLLEAPCASSANPSAAASCVCDPPSDWSVALSPVAPAGMLSPALLGQYDLSGALFHYDQIPGLSAALAGAGFAEWRVGVGRWESSTQMLPSLTGGGACSYPIPAAFAPPGTTDTDLIAARDWFTDDGQPVTQAETLDDGRYALGYLRSVIDVATGFGAVPYVSIDHMPRALAANRQPVRTDCLWSSMNRVSNVRPADPTVFGSAVAGLVKRIVEGSGGEPARPVTHWEIWNEPELPQFWDPTFDTGLDQFFLMAANALVSLDGYRRSSALPAVKAQRFGLGSFASAATASAMLGAFDASPIPGYGPLPIDFVSFHSYHDDPLAIAADVDLVAAARASSQHYGDVELVLAEWGPDLAHASDAAYGASLDPSLVVATALALGAASGLSRTHHALFYDFYDPLAVGLIDHQLRPRPLYYAYALLHGLIGTGASRLAPAGHENGRFDGGLGAALAARDSAGDVRVLLVNRNDTLRTMRVDVDGATRTPVLVTLLDDPASPPRTVPARWSTVVLPPRSIALVDLGTVP